MMAETVTHSTVIGDLLNRSPVTVANPVSLGPKGLENSRCGPFIISKASGIGVGDGVTVGVAVGVTVGTGDGVAVGEGVGVGVTVGVGEGVAVAVGTGVGVSVGVAVAVEVGGT